MIIVLGCAGTQQFIAHSPCLIQKKKKIHLKHKLIPCSTRRPTNKRDRVNGLKKKHSEAIGFRSGGKVTKRRDAVVKVSGFSWDGQHSRVERPDNALVLYFFIINYNDNNNGLFVSILVSGEIPFDFLLRQLWRRIRGGLDQTPLEPVHFLGIFIGQQNI